MKKLIFSYLIILTYTLLPVGVLAHLNDNETNLVLQEVSFEVKVIGEKAISGASVSIYNGTTILAASKTNSQGIANIILKNFNGQPIIVKIRAAGYKYFVKENVSVSQGETIKINLIIT